MKEERIKKNKKESSFVLMVAKPSLVQVRDTSEGVGGDVFMVSEDASSRHKFFYVLGTVQLNDIWILAGLGSARNLIA